MPMMVAGWTQWLNTLITSAPWLARTKLSLFG